MAAAGAVVVAIAVAGMRVLGVGVGSLVQLLFDIQV